MPVAVASYLQRQTSQLNPKQELVSICTAANTMAQHAAVEALTGKNDTETMKKEYIQRQHWEDD